MIDATPSHAVLREFLDNSSLTWGLVACGAAQLSKLVLELILHRRWRPAVLVETGGMPSSHSALVTGTAASTRMGTRFRTVMKTGPSTTVPMLSPLNQHSGRIRTGTVGATTKHWGPN